MQSDRIDCEMLVKKSKFKGAHKKMPKQNGLHRIFNLSIFKIARLFNFIIRTCFTSAGLVSKLHDSIGTLGGIEVAQAILGEYRGY